MPDKPVPPSQPPAARKTRWRLDRGLGYLGFALLLWVLWKLDLRQIAAQLQSTDLALAVAALLFYFPVVYLKTVRWQRLSAALAIRNATLPAALAYSASIFLGLATPGRLGEFARAFYLRRNTAVSWGAALASVILDRMFDLYIIVLAGGLALAALALGSNWRLLLGLSVVLTLPFVLLLPEPCYDRLRQMARHWPRLQTRLFGEDGLLRLFRQTVWRVWPGPFFLCLGFTLLVYALILLQYCMLARAAGLQASTVEIGCAVAVGSLGALLPISVAGLGSQELMMIGYLAARGLVPEAAAAFSLLAYLVATVFPAVVGLAALWLQPLSRTEVLAEAEQHGQPGFLTTEDTEDTEERNH